MSPLEYGPWAFFNYINPMLSIGLAYLGFGIFRKSERNNKYKVLKTDGNEEANYGEGTAK